MPDLGSLPPLRIEGENLNRTAVRLPEDLTPGPCLVLFAFSPTHQGEAQSWIEPLTELVTSGRVDAKQVIVLPAFAKLGAGIVFDQLIKTIPPEAHAATIVAFTDPGSVAKAAGASDASHIILSLLDASRRVAWVTTGAHTAEKEQALRAQLDGPQ